MVLGIQAEDETSDRRETEEKEEATETKTEEAPAKKTKK